MLYQLEINVKAAGMQSGAHHGQENSDAINIRKRGGIMGEKSLNLEQKCCFDDGSSYHCRILKAKECDGCKFRKTKSQFNADAAKAKKLNQKSGRKPPEGIYTPKVKEIF